MGYLAGLALAYCVWPRQFLSESGDDDAGQMSTEQMERLFFLLT